MLRARFLDDEQHPCHDQESADALDAVETVTYVAPADIKKDEQPPGAHPRGAGGGAQEGARWRRSTSWRRSSRRSPPRSKLLEKRAAEKPAMAAVEKRLTCEGLLGAEASTTHHQTGVYDDAMRLAVRRFQQKHMIYEANFLRRKTVEALARPLLDNDYDALVRALRERVVSAAGDRRGRLDVRRCATWSTSTPRWRSTQLGLDRRRRARWPSSSATGTDEFKTLRAAVKLPPRPDYYAPTWISRSSSIAATSGTTCRSTTRGTTSRRRARSTRR